jgi:hypothetical protein
VQTPSAVVRSVLPSLRRLITTEGLVGAIEQLLLATGEDSQATSAQAAAAALPILLASQGREETGATVCDAACISAVAAGILTRAAVCIGATAPRDALQHHAATACVCDLARQHPQEVVNVVLTADMIENSSYKCSLIRNFAVSALISAATDPLLGTHTHTHTHTHTNTHTHTHTHTCTCTCTCTCTHSLSRSHTHRWSGTEASVSTSAQQRCSAFTWCRL